MAGTLDDLALSLAGVAARLREAGEEGLVRELNRGIARAVAPVPRQVRAGLGDHMPHRYAGTLDAGLRTGRRTFTSPEAVQVTVYATNRGATRRKLRRLDSGVLWHPLFGRFPRRDPRNRWFEQAVRPGWFDEPVLEAVPRVREAVRTALDEVVRKAAGK